MKKLNYLLTFGIASIALSFGAAAFLHTEAKQVEATNASTSDYTLTLIWSDFESAGFSPRLPFDIYKDAVCDDDPTLTYQVHLYSNEVRNYTAHLGYEVIYFNYSDDYFYCLTDLGSVNSVTRTTGAIGELDYQDDFIVLIGNEARVYEDTATGSGPYFTLTNKGVTNDRCFADSIIVKFTLNCIYFDANGGSGECAPQHYNSNDSVKDCSFTRDGYVFKCWNTSPDGSGTDYYYGDLIGASQAGITLYAKWILPATTYSGTIPINVSGGEWNNFIYEAQYYNIAVCLEGMVSTNRAWTNILPIGRNSFFLLEYKNIPFEPVGFTVVATAQNVVYRRQTPEDAAYYYIRSSGYTQLKVSFKSTTAEYIKGYLVTIDDFTDDWDNPGIRLHTSKLGEYSLYNNGPIVPLDNLGVNSSGQITYNASYYLPNDQEFFVKNDLAGENSISYTTDRLADYFTTYYDKILCKKAGTYNFSYDPANDLLTISANFVDEAYDYAEYFNDTVTCTGDGSIITGDLSVSQ